MPQCRSVRNKSAVVAGKFARGLVCVVFAASAFSSNAGEPKKKGKKTGDMPENTAAKKEEGLTIPLPVGHEAKGLVLPDFDLLGHQRGRFEAGSAKRVDEGHIAFTDLKIQTFTAEDKPDLAMEMRESLLDVKTHLLTTQQRTTLKRRDFEMSGDTMEFDTNTHKGTMKGNVKMVILDQSSLSGKKAE